MKYFKAILKPVLSDEKGLSLIEIVIAVALIMIITSAFATATLSSTAVNQKNFSRQTLRSGSVGTVDKKVAKAQTYTASELASYTKANIKISSSSASSGSKGYRNVDCYAINGTSSAFTAYVTENETEAP